MELSGIRTVFRSFVVVTAAELADQVAGEIRLSAAWREYPSALVGQLIWIAPAVSETCKPGPPLAAIVME